MNNLTEESELGDCLICLSKIENYDVLLPGQEYQKIVDSCWNYLHENIANSKLQIIKSKNENELPLCKKCFDAASKLTELSEHVIKSQKKISDLKFEFQLGVLARRTKVESVKNVSDGQNSPKEFIVLDVSGISPSLFTTHQHNPTEMDDFAPTCENNFTGVDLNNPQHIFEIVKHESEEVVDGQSAQSEDDTNITKDEDLPVYTRPVIVLKKLKEADISENSISNTNSLPQQPDVTNPKHQMRNESSKKIVGQSTFSNFIQGETGNRNLKKKKKRGRVDFGKTEHKCHECEKVFTHLGHLNEHIRVHTGEKPYQCSFCAKTFAKLSNVKDHERIHTGEKPFKCSFCVKSFAGASQKRRHERTHTGETPFKCAHCSKTFKQSNSLRNHLRVHTGEKTS